MHSPTANASLDSLFPSKPDHSAYRQLFLKHPVTYNVPLYAQRDFYERTLNMLPGFLQFDEMIPFAAEIIICTEKLYGSGVGNQISCDEEVEDARRVSNVMMGSRDHSSQITSTVAPRLPPWFTKQTRSSKPASIAFLRLYLGRRFIMLETCRHDKLARIEPKVIDIRNNYRPVSGRG